MIGMKKQYLNVFIAGINRTALREIKLLQELKHPNIIGVSMKDPSVYSLYKWQRFWNSKSFSYLYVLYIMLVSSLHSLYLAHHTMLLPH